jgi:hypothetical protein
VATVLNIHHSFVSRPRLLCRCQRQHDPPHDGEELNRAFSDEKRVRKTAKDASSEHFAERFFPCSHENRSNIAGISWRGRRQLGPRPRQISIVGKSVQCGTSVRPLRRQPQQVRLNCRNNLADERVARWRRPVSLEQKLDKEASHIPFRASAANLASLASAKGWPPDTAAAKTATDC